MSARSGLRGCRAAEGPARRRPRAAPARLALFCRNAQNLIRRGADQVVDLMGPLVRLGTRQIDLVQDGYDFQAGVHGQQEIGQRLCLNPLRRIHNQNRALAGNQ